MSRAAAEALIAELVGSVAELLRTTTATARHYLTDEATAGIAESIAFSLVDESPGAELYDAPLSVLGTIASTEPARRQRRQRDRRGIRGCHDAAPT